MSASSRCRSRRAITANSARAISVRSATFRASRCTRWDASLRTGASSTVIGGRMRRRPSFTIRTIADANTRRSLLVGHVPILLLQLAVILTTARLLGLLLGQLGQPPVIGEMIAGILLGPIVFGMLAPETHAFLFPREKIAALDGLSQVGLVLFMFVVGAEIRTPSGARERLVAAGWVGTLGVLLPMGLGLAIAPALHEHFAPAGVGFWPFALFMAASMAITAFPVMARILKERSLTRTTIG